MKHSRPVVVVQGAEDASAVPGLDAFSDLAEFRFADDSRSLADALPGADVMLGWNFREVNLAEVWPQAVDLKWIQWSGAGVDSVLFDDLVESDVVLTNLRGLFDRAIAEYALGRIIMFAKSFDETLVDQQARRWHYRLTETIIDKSVLVVGVGSIGREIARVLGAVGMNVSGIGRRARQSDPDFIRIDSVQNLDQRLGEADYVVLITPLTDDTNGLFGVGQFAAMKRTARFLNFGRGELCDETALIEALAAGTIAGAAIDVFCDEPLPKESPFWLAPNCLVSPHMCGDFTDYPIQATKLFGENLRRYIDRQPLKNIVDKKAGFVTS